MLDDSQLYLSSPVRDATLAVAQSTQDIRNIASWCCKNSLLINLGKTKGLILGTLQMLAKLSDNVYITLLNMRITPSKSVKNLGVVMDCSLTYNERISNLCQINRVKHLFDNHTLVTIINSLVFSKLYYCSSVWANTTKKHFSTIQAVQNFAARIVTGTRKYDHVTPSLEQLQWVPVSEQLVVWDAVMIFKCVHGLVPPYFLHIC